MLYDQLPNLFPSAAIEITHSAPSTKLRYNYLEGQGYFIVSTYVDVSNADINTLKEFVNRGNVLVISAYFLDKKLEEWLGVSFTPALTITTHKDSIQAYDLDEDEFESYHLGRTYRSFISKFDSLAVDLQVLGKYPNGNVSAISFKLGDGYVVLHSQPYMFSNYHLIKKGNKGYSELFFSVLPGPLNLIYWDEYSKGGNRGATPLKYVLSQPALSNAFWWSLGGLLLLVFFSFKRRQRIIPVLPPLNNSSLDMVRTVSDMYYYSHKNEVMAKKKILHWLEYLRTKYNIFANQSQEAFWQSVKLRAGMPDEQIAELRSMIDHYRDGNRRISDEDLVKLDNLIDEFYKS